jgi:hypothetical protein
MIAAEDIVPRAEIKLEQRCVAAQSCVLEPPCVHSPGRRCVSGRMPQRVVDMYRQWQSSSLPNPLNHPFTAQAGHDLCVEVKARADGGNPLLVLRLSLAVRSPTRELLNFGSIRKLVG